MKCWTIALVIGLLVGACTTEAETLKQEGFQVFPEMNIALKCPCELKLDKKMTKEQSLELDAKVFAYSCKDSLSTNYVFHALEEDNPNGNSEKNREDAYKALNQKFELKKQMVAGAPALRFTYSWMSVGMQVYKPRWNYFLVVYRSLNPDRDMKALTSSIRFIGE